MIGTKIAGIAKTKDVAKVLHESLAIVIVAVFITTKNVLDEVKALASKLHNVIKMISKPTSLHDG